MHVGTAVADAARSYELVLPIPNVAALIGARSNAQVWFLTLPSILPIETTNGVQRVLGS